MYVESACKFGIAPDIPRFLQVNQLIHSFLGTSYYTPSIKLVGIDPTVSSFIIFQEISLFLPGCS